jgi:hypothetical protein
MDSAPFDISEPVVDRDSTDDDPNTAIIVNCPPKIATDWTAYRQTTVAEDNPDYPDDALIAIIVYRDELAEFDPDWADRNQPFSLTEFNEAGVSHYAFPAPRLKSLASDADDDNTATDTENETEPEMTEEEMAEADDNNTESDTEIETEAEMAEAKMADEVNTNATPTASTKNPTNTDDTDDSDDTEESEDESASGPPPAVRDLKETLADRGLTVEIETDGQTVAAEKLGVTYRVQPGEVLDGDGPHREKIEQIVAEA